MNQQGKPSPSTLYFVLPRLLEISLAQSLDIEMKIDLCESCIQSGRRVTYLHNQLIKPNLNLDVKYCIPLYTIAEYLFSFIWGFAMLTNSAYDTWSRNTSLNVSKVCQLGDDVRDTDVRVVRVVITAKFASVSRCPADCG